MDWWMDRWIDGWMAGWINPWIHRTNRQSIESMDAIDPSEALVSSDLTNSIDMEGKKLEVTLTSIDTIMFSIVKNNLYASCYAWDR